MYDSPRSRAEMRRPAIGDSEEAASTSTGVSDRVSSSARIAASDSPSKVPSTRWPEDEIAMYRKVGTGTRVYARAIGLCPMRTPAP